MQGETYGKAVVAGHICLDIMPELLNEEGIQIQEILSPGALIQTGNADIHVGGCVANTGLGMKIFGADVTLVGKIGADDFGNIVKGQLTQYASADNMIVSADASTSYSIVLAPKGIDRMFLHHPGANHTFDEQDIDYEIIKDAQLFHFGYPPLMKRFYENDGAQLVEMFSHVHQLGVSTSLDMVEVDVHSDAAQADWEKIIKNILPYLDFFMPSVEELAYMIDRPRLEEWIKRANGRDVTEVLRPDDIAPLAEKLISWGARVVLIKCGALGLFFATGNRKVLEQIGGGYSKYLRKWENIRHFEPSYKPNAVLSGTGAGDTCIAAFLCSVMRRLDWSQCLKYASAAGACCVESYDAVSGLLSFDEMDRRIEMGWKKNFR